MRIAHVVTYISEDGAFGGPVAVASAQAAELARRGHEVDLLAGWDGRANVAVRGVNTRLFSVQKVGPGFSGLIAPGLVRFIGGSGDRYDVVHVHMGRDLVSFPAARVAQRRGLKTVLQTHGMVMPDTRRRTQMFDRLGVSGALERSRAVLVLTSAEQEGVARLAPASRLVRIPNGVPLLSIDRTPNTVPLVLFLARLHPRKGVIDFAKAATLVAASGQRASFRVIGPDEGDLDKLEPYLVENGGAVEYGGVVAPGEAVRELARADLYVLPSREEVFPMTVLESLSVGTPVLVGEDCGIGPDLAARGAASLVAHGAAPLAAEIAALLASPAKRSAQALAGTKAVEDWLSISMVASRLEELYK